MEQHLGANAQIPRRSGYEIEQEASTFLENNWSGQFPVDVDEICDAVGINICYVRNLKRDFGLDAYTNSDFSMITVDQDCALKYENRYRFSVAHEIGHFVLHKEYYPTNIYDIETYLRYANGYINGPAEQEANAFAGALLVPLDELQTQLTDYFGNDMIDGAHRKGKDESAKFLLKLADFFMVSKEVLLRRIKRFFPGLLDTLAEI